jgi:hypothetical protein
MKLLVYGSKFSETAATVNMHASTYMIMTNTCMYRNLYIIIQVLPEHENLHNKTMQYNGSYTERATIS